MRILFLTDNFPPEVNAPASRTLEHCREWVRAGHEVTVVTGVPNFPTGRIFGGYRNYPWQQEVVEGIRVIRVVTYITANEGFGRRTIDYASFMVTSCLAGLMLRRHDIVVGTSPQFFTVCSAWMISALRRIPYVFEVRDLWPDSIRAVGAMKNSFWLNRLKRLEYFLYRKASLVVTLTKSFRNTLIEGGADGERIRVVLNGVDLRRYRCGAKDPDLVRRHALEGKFVVGYIGTHGLAHSLETIVEAAALAKEEGKEDSYLFLFLGDGARKRLLEEMAEKMKLDNVVFVDTVPKDEVVKYWSVLDASVIHLKKTALFESVIPSKLFESMAMGIPVLHGVRGESAEIVNTEQTGLVFEPEDPSALFKALERLSGDRALYEALQENCRRAVRHHDRRKQAEKMLKCLQEVVSG